jgi:predicted RNA-binding protein with PIN domain
MSVHTQIKLVERYKSLSGGAKATKTTTGPKGGSAVNNKGTVGKTGFRKTKDDAYQEELARRRAAKQAEARHLETLKSFRGAGAPPTLIVDGYNVCGCDEGEKAGLGLKEAFMAGDLETAQRRLVDELDTLGAHKGYRIVCVFDADRTANDRGGGSGGLDAASRTEAGTWVVFSVTNDADSWIERASIEELAGESSVDAVLRKTRQANGGRVASETLRAANRDEFGAGAGDASGDARSAVSRTVYVATSDNALSSVVRGNGAYAVSAGSLVEELTRARRDETEILRELSVKARWGGEKRGLAMVAVDASTADKLMEMYKAAPNTSAVEKFGSRTGGFSSKPKKGKKNKGKK